MKKRKYRVSDYASISECLDQIDQDGFKPVKRFEKPIFQESEDHQEPVPIKQEIIFEAVEK
ncbi:NETI motif-containing protein [Alkalibacillus aidingensis]|uniref:NETI motif-containing protein n=1 Tax=Alkalibacillus aidingensis TaxID=2747607 RepID=UPI001660630A|nr:NETI motif-containing protein [Alkalibacillus aidingensis]